jgi:dipeptidyl aminopeptidase/acylaminoacyl peptidase
LYGNYSLISSTVKIDTVDGSIKDRPLQGQSPYVFNAGLVYQDNDKGWDAAVTINRVGRRIAYIANEEKQIIWENPRTIIDLSISKVIAKKLTIRFVAGDVLAQDLVFYQDLNTNKKYDKGGDVTAFRFQNGFTTTLSINFKF